MAAILDKNGHKTEKTKTNQKQKTYFFLDHGNVLCVQKLAVYDHYWARRGDFSDFAEIAFVWNCCDFRQILSINRPKPGQILTDNFVSI